ncbi:unnamed protein product, partial [Mesorhabditis spiculigera]
MERLPMLARCGHSWVCGFCALTAEDRHFLNCNVCGRLASEYVPWTRYLSCLLGQTFFGVDDDKQQQQQSLPKPDERLAITYPIEGRMEKYQKQLETLKEFIVITHKINQKVEKNKEMLESIARHQQIPAPLPVDTQNNALEEKMNMQFTIILTLLCFNLFVLLALLFK